MRDRVSFALPADLNPYEDFSLYEVDSLRVLEILLCVETMAGILFPPPETPMLASFADAFDYFKYCCTYASEFDN